jgi:hypothetical protein
MNNSKFHNRAKSVIIINVTMLLKSFCNKLGFVPINSPIRLPFNLIDSFAIN